MAGSSVTLTQHSVPDPVVGVIVVAAVADDADGSFPTFILPEFEGRIFAVDSDPGATAPTDNYDVAITNQRGLDVLGAAGANRDTANSERAAVTSGYVDRTDTLTLAITGNSVNDATLTLAVLYTQDM